MGITYEALYRERELMDQALAVGKLEVELRSTPALRNFRQRCYTARSLDRKRSMEIYQPGHPYYGRSQYDGLQFIQESPTTLIIENQPDDLPLGVRKVTPGKPE